VWGQNDELGFEIGKRRCDTLAQDTLVVWPLVLGVIVPKQRQLPLTLPTPTSATPVSRFANVWCREHNCNRKGTYPLLRVEGERLCVGVWDAAEQELVLLLGGLGGGCGLAFEGFLGQVVDGGRRARRLRLGVGRVLASHHHPVLGERAEGLLHVRLALLQPRPVLPNVHHLPTRRRVNTRQRQSTTRLATRRDSCTNVEGREVTGLVE